MRRCKAALAATTAVALAAGPTAADVGASTYVGKVKGSGAFIAVAKDGRKIGAYLCDNGTISRWIEYAWLHKGRAPLLRRTTGTRVGAGKVAGSTATGTIRVAGAKHAFRPTRVKGRRS